MTLAPAIVNRQPNASEHEEAQPPRLLFFFSPTSGASRRTEGFLAHVLQRRANHSTFHLIRIDADRRPDLVERLQVRHIPTLLVVNDGKVCARLSTPKGVRQVRHLLGPWLR